MRNPQGQGKNWCVTDSDAYVRAINLLGVDEFITSKGGDFKALLNEVGLSADALDDLDALLPFRRCVTFSELAAARLNEPNLFLEFVAKSGPDYAFAGPVMMLARFAKDGEDMARMAIRYWAFHTNAYNFVYLHTPDSPTAIFRLSVDALFYPSKQLADAVLGTIVGLARTVANRHNDNPTRVRFQHRRPADTSLYESFFRCPVEFGAEYDDIEFDVEFLRYRTPAGLRMFKPLMHLYITERIRRLPHFDHSTTRTVALAIAATIGSGNCSIETVAEGIGQNVKQLQRLLAKEGTSFSAILDDVRNKLARKRLEDSNISISRIAGLLDYASSAPFIAAFHRWTGMTPLRFRQLAREQRRSDKTD
jgi:AraC-like DNA-binding protein